MLFHRFLRTILQLFFMLTAVILSILIPLNVVHEKSTTNEIENLDRLSWANVDFNRLDYYWTHLMLLLYTVILICATIYRKTTFYVKIRQMYLWSHSQTSKSKIKTILITEIPEHLKDSEKLRALYDSTFDDVQTVWINRNCRKFTKVLRHREKFRILLKATEVRLIKRSLSICITENAENDLTKTKKLVCSQHIRQHKKQNKRLTFLPWLSVLFMIDKRVNLIQYYREKMIRYNNDISKIQSDCIRYSAISSVFIMFNNVKNVNITIQSLIDFKSAQMIIQCIEVEPQNIVWKNVDFEWWKRTFRTLCARICVLFMIEAWALLIAFTDFLSQVSYVMNFWSRLRFLAEISKSLLSLIQEIFPQTLLMIFIILVSQLIRILTEQQELFTISTIESSIQVYYFEFLFIQIFLIVSLFSSFTTIISQIYRDFDFVPKTLAQNLPKISNYFFSYILLQSFSLNTDQLIQIMILIRWYVLTPLFDITSKAKVHKNCFLHSQMQWNTIFSVFIILTCIDKCYHSIWSWV